MRIATFHTELERDGPGLLLRDVISGKDAQVEAVLQVIAAARADILLLQGIDWDLEARALSALRDRLAERGIDYPHLLAPRPNAGVASGRDLDGNGRLGEARDAHGYGRFAGQGAMALLSRHPIERGALRDFTGLAWRDLPGAQQPRHADGRPFPSAEVQKGRKLFSQGAWAVPVRLPSGRALTIMAMHANTPVFDGPEDANGLRNRDELRFWRLLLDGALGPPPEPPLVLLGDANLDPFDGAGRREAITGLLRDARLRDLRPVRPGPASGPALLDTVDWPEPKPGNLRVSYILASPDIAAREARVLWPREAEPLAAAVASASRHRLIWADIVVGP